MASTRLTTDNYLDPDVIANDYVTSEQAAFPISNAYNAQRRSKVWRSNGYWVMPNNSIFLRFKETTGGGELSAFVAAANTVFTSNASFFAAIKAAMELVGGSTYTISQDTLTKKIKFESDLAGGGNDFEIIWSAASSERLGEVLGFDTDSDDTGADTYLADELRINTYERITWDLGLSTNPQAFFLIGPRNSAIKLSSSAVIKLEGNETNNWDDPTFTTTLAYDTSVIQYINANGFHTEGLRYWSLYIEDYSNPQGYLEVGSLFLGDFFEATRGRVQFPFSGSYIDRSPTVFSEGGQTFSDIREKSEAFTLDWYGLTVADKEQIDDLFTTYGTSIPFFIVLDPNEAFSSTAGYYVRYVKFESPPSYSLESPGNYACAMSLREEL